MPGFLLILDPLRGSRGQISNFQVKFPGRDNSSLAVKGLTATIDVSSMFDSIKFNLGFCKMFLLDFDSSYLFSFIWFTENHDTVVQGHFFWDNFWIIHSLFVDNFCLPVHTLVIVSWESSFIVFLFLFCGRPRNCF